MYLGRTKLPPIFKSVVPFDMGGNTIRHNGVKDRTVTQNIKNTYNITNSQNANGRLLKLSNTNVNSKSVITAVCS
jgi:hypothetical protein